MKSDLQERNSYIRKISEELQYRQDIQKELANNNQSLKLALDEK